MITKQECLTLLFDLKDSGIDCTDKIKHLLVLSEPDIETIKFINDNRELNVRKFYEKLRHSYNHKKSKLYINIVSEQEKAVLDRNHDVNFLRNTRFNEISKVLLNYYNTKDIIPCIKLLELVKADLKTLEYISKENT